VTLSKWVPTGLDADRLDDLLTDALAIPPEMFARADRAHRPATAGPAAVMIPPASVALVVAAEHQLAGYRRFS
jgi:hypothetical protein